MRTRSRFGICCLVACFGAGVHAPGALAQADVEPVASGEDEPDGGESTTESESTVESEPTTPGAGHTTSPSEPPPGASEEVFIPPLDPEELVAIPDAEESEIEGMTGPGRWYEREVALGVGVGVRQRSNAIAVLAELGIVESGPDTVDVRRDGSERAEGSLWGLTEFEVEVIPDEGVERLSVDLSPYGRRIERSFDDGGERARTELFAGLVTVDRDLGLDEAFVFAVNLGRLRGVRYFPVRERVDVFVSGDAAVAGYKRVHFESDVRRLQGGRIAAVAVDVGSRFGPYGIFEVTYRAGGSGDLTVGAIQERQFASYSDLEVHTALEFDFGRHLVLSTELSMVGATNTERLENPSFWTVVSMLTAHF